jgi:hypothetical protein
MPKNTITFADSLLPLVAMGRKEVTIRQGAREYDEVLTVTGPTGIVQPFKIKVTSVRHFKVADVPAMAIEDDGFRYFNEFFSGLKLFYPDSSLDDDCTVVRFELYVPPPPPAPTPEPQPYESSATNSNQIPEPAPETPAETETKPCES